MITQEDKELMFNDLCTRLPYGLRCRFESEDCTIMVDSISCRPDFGKIVIFGYNKLHRYTPETISHAKPYLRSMDSMISGEKAEYNSRRSEKRRMIPKCVVTNAPEYEYYDNYQSIDWLNKHMFDYRGLIDKGLALDAPEGMYS